MYVRFLIAPFCTIFDILFGRRGRTSFKGMNPRAPLLHGGILRSIQRNNKRVRNAKHVEKDTKLCKEFDSTFPLEFFSFF